VSEQQLEILVLLAVLVFRQALRVLRLLVVVVEAVLVTAFMV
jgi:hypothetical protein